MKNKIRKRYNFRKKVLTFLIIFLSLIVLGFSIYKIIKWNNDNNRIKEQEEKIKEISNLTEVSDNENTETVNPPEDEFDPYWDYIKMNLIDVNFDDLLKENKDTVGFISVGGTNINYPVVQCSNNDFYLNHDFYEKWNDAGWIFMDYTNNSSNFDRNTVIYGHSRVDKSMFGSLRNVLNSSWNKVSENKIIKFSTPKANTLWQVFSVYKIKAEDYYIKTSFTDDSEYQTWLNTVFKRSIYNFNTKVNTKDKVLTLSTCFDTKGNRVAVHAKLIKIENK